MKLGSTCSDETWCSVDAWNPFQTRVKLVLLCLVDRDLENLSIQIEKILISNMAFFQFVLSSICVYVFSEVVDYNTVPTLLLLFCFFPPSLLYFLLSLLWITQGQEHINHIQTTQKQREVKTRTLA